MPGKDPWVGRAPAGGLTPDMVADDLEWLKQAASQAQDQLEIASKTAAVTKLDWESAKRRVHLDENTPKVSRDFPVGQREAYIESQCEREEFAYRVAEATLAAARTKITVLGMQSDNTRSQNTNLRGERGEKWTTEPPNRNRGR